MYDLALVDVQAGVGTNHARAFTEVGLVLVDRGLAICDAFFESHLGLLGAGLFAVGADVDYPVYWVRHQSRDPRAVTSSLLRRRGGSTVMS